MQLDSTTFTTQSNGLLRDVRLPSADAHRSLAHMRSAAPYPIIAHSHLEWDWVWQRPQQFLSRFSREHRVLFVEGPKTEAISRSRMSLRQAEDHPNVLILQMWMPEDRWHDGEWMDEERHRLLKRLLTGPLGDIFANPVQWFYDPMAVTSFASRMNERAIVYDCMDQLSQFRGAHPELVQRERQLLAMADIVFAGGPKIHSAKRLHNENCHAFGCGADVAHFGKAMLAETVVPSDVAQLSGPVLGYFGVVDERLDYDMIAALADAHPAGNVVIVGPVAKVDPAAFPKRPNLHWLGGRDYSQLPGYVKSFDACLMPFALNAATEFINPTKALEYMAAGKPIVSTAVEDVVLQFTGIVKVARSPEEFIRTAWSTASHPDRGAIERGLTRAARNTWEAIVSRMEDLIADTLATKEASDVRAA